MTDLFLDTDVILDYVGNRKPFAEFAMRTFEGAHQGKFRIHTSGNSITITHYILCKTLKESKARLDISDLLDFIHIIPIDQKVLKQAFRSGFNDFEDAVQHECSLTVSGMQFIVTRNLRDYKKSRIKAIGPESLF